jgi:hypothetical protein
MNPEAKVARIALAALIGIVCLAFVPWLIGLDMMRGGYAMIAFCVFLGIGACVTWLVFLRRARILDRFFEGSDVLARWEVPPQVWVKHVAADLKEERRDKKTLYLIVVGWSVVIGGGFVVYDPKDGLWVAATLALMLVILLPFAFWMPRRRAARMLTKPTPVIIGREGAYVGGELHDWRLIGSFFVHAEIDAKREPWQLLLNYCYLTRYGAPMPVVVRIPVPPGAEAEAARVVETLNKSKKKKDKEE